MYFPQPLGPSWSHLHTRRSLVQRAATLGLGAVSILPGTAVGQPANLTATPSTTATRSITRDEYLAAVRRHFAFEPPSVQGGHAVSVVANDPLGLNPMAAGDAFSARVLENVFSALVRPSLIDGNWAPDLADYWEVSADGLVYTFHLNREAAWHDGHPLTVHDVTFTLDALLDESSLSGFRSNFLKMVDRYHALDDHTFILFATQPYTTLIDNTVGWMTILPRHIWELVPLDEWGAVPGATGADPSQVVGSGPFAFGEWVHGEHISVVRNDAYWVPEMIPVLDEFTWRVLPNADAGILALVAGEVDYCFVPSVQVQPLQEGNPELEFTAYDASGWLFYALNGDPQHEPFFVDPRVRQAMLYALDRDAIIATMLGGYGTRADGIYPPTSPLWAPEQVTTIYEYDPVRARSLLDEAGWLETGNGVRAKDDVEFRVEILFSEMEEIRRLIVTYMQQAWGEIGIMAQPIALEFAILLDRMDQGDYQVALGGQDPGNGEQGDIYRCDRMPPNGGNIQRICSPEFDRLNEASLFELDPVKRRELLIEQGNIVNDAATLGVLFFRQATVGSQPRLRNFFANNYAQAGSLPWLWTADDV